MAKHFAVCAAMAENDQDICTAMDMVSANAGVKNGKITIGVPAEVVHKMLANPGGYYTQLIVINAAEYDAIRDRMDRENSNAQS